MRSNCNTRWLFHLLLPLFIFSLNTHISKGSDTIYSGQSLFRNQTITSQGGVFELGFFNPGNSQNYYVGIWYKSAPNKTVVWVANRNQPISDPFSSELKLLENGNLVLIDQSETRIWSTNSTSKIGNSTIGILLDNGNFVLRERLDSSNVIWQSFDYPTNTWLPGGKVGFNKLSNEKQILTSWKSSENPAQSLFSLEVEANSTHILLWNGTQLYWSSGVWDGKVFSLVPEIALDYYIKNVTYVSNVNGSYFTYEAGFPTFLTRFVLDVTGQLKQYVWGKNFTQWSLFWTRPTSQCDVYNFCGSFSSCNQDLPICACIEGFGPKNPAAWELGDHSDGCVRRTPLECRGNESNDTFVVVANTRFPGNSEGIISSGKIEECQVACLRNCSCTAYAFDNGCLIWKNALFNLQKFQSNDGSGRDIHVRVAGSSVVATGTSMTNTKKKTKWIVLGVIGLVFIFSGLILAILWRRRSKQGRGNALEAVEDSLIVFKFRDIRNSTKNFTEKLGEGGFGSVFKGTLPNSSTVAVKSLKSLKKEGEKQFRAEVSTLGMIQHINLIHLRGFCIKGTKKFLVYDYMPKGSLESHLFNKNPTVLDWKTRFNIAIGTARGLTYLHEKLEGNCDVEELKRACKVACWCIQDDEKDRPSMGQVVQILEGISEVGIPPVPRFIQGFADSPMEVPFDLQPISDS
ncbi:hypothetical protein Vadar_029226 [Vaccinium darrowii]|uniref:Uncharacterized protein n=1 Tax=Vaccinium darrowii TaxID=229202 RepID=A0ACB7Z8G8_9ERIC|nr:hypothetical protein Vadar_029226 [Vaccinium darrowii]